jgi:hypothetical protein
MFGTGGIEVSTGGFEVRWNAIGRLMEVDGVDSRGKVLEGQMDADTLLMLADGCASDAASTGVDQFDNFDGLFGSGSRAHHGNGKRDGHPGAAVHVRSFREKRFHNSPPSSALDSNSVRGTTESRAWRTRGELLNNALFWMSASTTGCPMAFRRRWALLDGGTGGSHFEHQSLNLRDEVLELALQARPPALHLAGAAVANGIL